MYIPIVWINRKGYNKVYGNILKQHSMHYPGNKHHDVFYSKMFCGIWLICTSLSFSKWEEKITCLRAGETYQKCNKVQDDHR